MKKLVFFLILLTVSANAQYTFSIERAGKAQRSGESNRVAVSVFRNGAPAYSVERTIPFDVPFPLVSLNENTGVLVLRYHFDGFVEIYDALGKKIWDHNFFKEEEPNYERTIGTVVGNSSIFFLVSDSRRENAVVHNFSLTGALLWTTVLPHQYAYEIALSIDERTIIAGSYLALEDEVRRSAALINGKGIIEGNVDILFRKAVFSEDNTLIALSSEREAVIVSNVSKKEIARTAKRSAGIITDMIWNGNELIVQESKVVTPNDGRFHFADPAIFSYSDSLRLIGERNITGIAFHASSLKRSGRQIILDIDEGKRQIPLE